MHPDCIRLVAARERPGGWRLAFEPTQWAGLYHACNKVRVDVATPGDPQPFSRFLEIRHLGGLVDERGARSLCGVFAPGERVEVWSWRGGFVLAHPALAMRRAGAAIDGTAVRRVSGAAGVGSRRGRALH